jgi:hypothetical protein
MPSIEIACIGQYAPAPIVATGFAVVGEDRLKSHRVPSRFQKDFDALSGYLYHLGNRSQRDAGEYGRLFAYELLSEASREPFPPSFLEFSSVHVDEVRAVLSSILAASPVGQVLFTSDWEFGPDWTHRFGPVSLEEFWRLHASRNLYLNSAYALVA